MVTESEEIRRLANVGGNYKAHGEAMFFRAVDGGTFVILRSPTGRFSTTVYCGVPGRLEVPPLEDGDPMRAEILAWLAARDLLRAAPANDTGITGI